MDESSDPIDRRLARLTRATEALSPQRGFADGVMLAMSAEPAAWLDAVRRTALKVLPVVALAAAAALVWAEQVDDAVDHELAATYGALEVDW